MGEFDAVVDQPDIGQEIEEVEQPQEQETQQPPEQQSGESDTKFSKRFSAWLKDIRDNATDPEIATFARTAKDSFSHMYSLKEMIPNGVDGVREMKATLDGLQHGELKGIEAIGAIQDQIRDYEQSDELLATGDPKVLSLFGPEFDEGLGKLTPALLDRLQQSSPQAYSQAVLPHLMSALAVSPMVQGLGQISNILNEQPPTWLTADQKTHWINEKFQKIVGSFNSIATWYDAQTDAVKGKQVAPTNGNVPPSQDKFAQERQELETEKRQMYWDKNIHPQTTSFGNNKFQELMKPYVGRLKLDETATKGLRTAFMNGVVNKLAQDRNYMSQLARYQGQRTPDAATVVNLANVNFDKHAKSVLEALVDERYRTFLGQKKTNTPVNGTAQRVQSPNGTRVVNVRPPNDEIDYPNTPTDWLNTKPDGSKQFRMKDGSIRIFKPNR